MTKKNKGFTIIELVIAISVIGILSAVSIPTFSGVIVKADLSSDIQICKNMNTLISTEYISGYNAPKDINEIKNLLINNNYETYLEPKSNNCHFYWNENDNRIYLAKDYCDFDIYYPNDEKDITFEEYLDTKNQYHILSGSTPNYLNFTALEDNSSVTASFWNGTFEYSIDYGVTWIPGDITGTTINLNKGEIVFMRGIDCRTGQYVNDKITNFKMKGKIAAGGSVTSLTDSVGNNPGVKIVPMAYHSMFSSCESLVKAPELPATTVPRQCYEAMFSGCINLEEAPELPATSLSEYCYSYMFFNCDKLEKAPELPAEYLAFGCYSCMFAECSNLKYISNLPATKFESRCYEHMFEGCLLLKIGCIDKTQAKNINNIIFTTGNNLGIEPADENYSYFIKMFSGTNNYTGCKYLEEDKTYYLITE